MWSLPICRVQDLALSDVSRISNTTLQWTESGTWLHCSGRCWQYVKPGGVLVYSTCTVNRLENDENRAWFLNEYPFEPVDISGRLGIDFQEDSLKEGYIQLYPGVHPCDGFFISVMKRKG